MASIFARVSLANTSSGVTEVTRFLLKASAAEIFLLNRSISLALAGRISRRNTYKEQHSGVRPSWENGVRNVAWKTRKLHCYH
ncbi:hypothetical protein DPMN_100992 [Dreissena polymorpha]|uniref:Uncharacterized protein n=1 Tax=Dreissena polymorpha TaxID=45954 RepID=A0A9D4LIG8_DREPO|nr:hypothetical protein DPMN_100992 [Dreissena polymorpha]